MARESKKVSNLVIEHAKVLFRNFTGREEKFNPAGKRNFCVVIDQDTAAKLRSDGWNVKRLQAREEGDEDTNYIQVSVSYANFPPKIYIVTSKGKKTLLDEDSVGQLDYAEIVNVDVIISPYYWEVSGKSGIKGYVKNMYVTIQEDVFADKYSDDDDFPF